MAKAIKTVKTKQQLQVLLNQVTGVGRELLAQWIDLDPIYVGELHKAEYVPSIKKHLLHAVDHVTVDGAWCEFGVREGRSLNWLIDYKPNQPIHGFDSWQGLPEDWDHGTGIVESMACNPPKVPGHVRLHEGWFHATTPKFEANTVGFLHMDADIYSSTKYVLFELNNKIVPGTVIVFDEFCNFRLSSKMSNWARDEFRGFQEWVEQCNRKIKPIGRNWAYQASCVVTL